ncbi:MAG: alpha-D-ribose 1-methylphosphonate 5-triphosphate diphosphatase [Actinomycetota bacterium]
MTDSGFSGSIRGGEVLLAGADRLETADLAWVDGHITSTDAPRPTGSAEAETRIDARGAYVLPGIIDLHGDAFERSLMPRGGVYASAGVAFDDCRNQLLASGITTAYISVTDSWEPGLRSRDTLLTIAEVLAAHQGEPDLKLHVRHERCFTQVDQILDWVADGTIHMLSFNDHTPGGITHIDGLSPSQISRAGVSADALEARMIAAMAERDTGLRQEEVLAEAATAAGCPLASHDSTTDADLARDRELGVAIAEFPATIELGARYQELGIDVMLGAPNLVRGGSHIGNLSVRDALAAGVGSIVCSDYHYPSLLQSPFVLDAVGIRPLASAWDLVAGAPARAAGLTDRGVLASGQRADVIVVEPPRGDRPARVVAVVCGGRVAWQAARRAETIPAAVV